MVATLGDAGLKSDICNGSGGVEQDVGFPIINYGLWLIEVYADWGLGTKPAAGIKFLFLRLLGNPSDSPYTYNASKEVKNQSLLWMDLELNTSYGNRGR